MIRANIFISLLRYTVTLATQDPYAQPLSWDERYAPFIRHVGFLPLADGLVSGHLPMMDSATLTAHVDRWRSETHMFHLLCGEITVML
jgi:hypothetical protein